MLFVVGSLVRWFVVCCSLFVEYCLLCVVCCCWLFVVCSFVFVVFCALFNVCCLWLIGVCCLLFFSVLCVLCLGAFFL